MVPRVIMSNAVSVDGRTTGFSWDIGLYYEMAARWKADVHLAGSDTLLSSAEGEVPEVGEDEEPPAQLPSDGRPLLVVPDSRGRIRNWHVLQRAPYWRGVVALCSHSTPHDYLEYLNKRRISYIVAGEHHVNMRAALEELNARYGVRLVHLDSGGTLNGVMLRAGLVNEVHLLVHPCLVGGQPSSIFRSTGPIAPDSSLQLSLANCQKLRDGIVWLHYSVIGARHSAPTAKDRELVHC